MDDHLQLFIQVKFDIKYSIILYPHNEITSFIFHYKTMNFRSFDKYNKFNASLGPIKNATIYKIDPRSGIVIEEFGQGIFYMPHGLTVDSNDNIWVTDVGLHQVRLM